jgi:hypothetical protein
MLCYTYQIFCNILIKGPMLCNTYQIVCLVITKAKCSAVLYQMLWHILTKAKCSIILLTKVCSIIPKARSSAMPQMLCHFLTKTKFSAILILCSFIPWQRQNTVSYLDTGQIFCNTHEMLCLTVPWQYSAIPWYRPDALPYPRPDPQQNSSDVLSHSDKGQILCNTYQMLCHTMTKAKWFFIHLPRPDSLLYHCTGQMTYNTDKAPFQIQIQVGWVGAACSGTPQLTRLWSGLCDAKLLNF